MVQKIARILNVLLMIALVCNIIILYLIPAIVLVYQDSSLLQGVQNYFASLLFPGEDDIVMAAYLAPAIIWLNGWFEMDTPHVVLALFLVFSGIQTAIILKQARRVLATILRGNPFSIENAVSLNRAAVCCFTIATAALIRVVFSVCHYHSMQPLASYNALFVPLFAMAGLLCLVMSALFRQAAELKAENDLTI